MIENEKEIENQIIEMGKLGLFGTIREFYHWKNFIILENKSMNKFDKEDYKNFTKVFHNLIQKNIFLRNKNLKNEYIYNEKLNFSRYIEYFAPASLNNSPIQFVRSRLLSFLNFHRIKEEIIYDIIIGVVEAVENAVKYSSDNKIFIKYFLEENTFYVEIQNKYKIPEIHHDIQTGKYNSSITLMRGMLVMSKIFDEMNIDLMEAEEIAVFQARKKVAQTIYEKI